MCFVASHDDLASFYYGVFLNFNHAFTDRHQFDGKGSDDNDNVYRIWTNLNLT